MKDVYPKDWRELKIGVFDTETTGLQAKTERITELGVVIFKAGEPVKSWCKLINPIKKIQPRASKLTGITDELVSTKKTFIERSERIKKLLSKVDIWCCYNDQFDRSFVIEEFRRSKVEFDEKPTIDPLIWANYIWPQGPNTLDNIVQRLHLRPPNEVMSDLGINASRHRADYDALMTGFALFGMAGLMPKSLRQTLYVQDFIYRQWLLRVKGNEKKFMRYLEPTMPPEHAE